MYVKAKFPEIKTKTDRRKYTTIVINGKVLKMKGDSLG